MIHHQRYADTLAERTNEYGTILLYYARGHCEQKIKEVLELLTSLSLVESAAYPSQSDLDKDLAQLVASPKDVLSALSSLDAGAAELLKTYLAGYATLRRFYNLRDSDVLASESDQTNKPSSSVKKKRPLARKREAATALIAVINSAADSIHGGLYDSDRPSIVNVDALLPLLAEALPFISCLNFPRPNTASATNIGNRKRTLTTRHIFALLKAIEDLQTVSSRIYDQCERCFQSCLTEARRARAPPASAASREAFLKKSISNLTTASSGAHSGFSAFSLLEYDDADAGMDVDDEARPDTGKDARSGSLEGSGVLVHADDDDAANKGKGRGGGRQKNVPEHEKGKVAPAGTQDENENGLAAKPADKVKRAWDWREALLRAKERTGGTVRGHDVLALLRVGLARELADAWIEGDV